MENLDLPYPTPASPKSRTGKWRVFAPRAASSLILGGGGDGGLLFHFILSEIVAILGSLTYGQGRLREGT